MTNSDGPESARLPAESEDTGETSLRLDGPSTASVHAYIERLDEQENAREEIAGFGVLSIGLFIPSVFVLLLLAALGVPSRFLILVFLIPLLAYRLYPYWIIHRSKLAMPWLPGVWLEGREKTKAMILCVVVVVAGLLANVLISLL